MRSVWAPVTAGQLHGELFKGRVGLLQAGVLTGGHVLDQGMSEAFAQAAQQAGMGGRQALTQRLR